MAALRNAWEDLAGAPMALVSGACPTGADQLCEEAAEALGWRIERHPADWPAACLSSCKPGHRRTRQGGSSYCPAAGVYRNQAMVDLGADLCLAFIHNGSSGASHCAAAAEAAGIDTRRYTGFRGGDRG